jgi:hypothetical protein
MVTNFRESLGWATILIMIGLGRAEFALANPDPLEQRWLEQIPDVRSQINQQPGFVTRWRLGYIQDYWEAGVADWFWGGTPITFNAAYQQPSTGDRPSEYRVEINYYLFPLGNELNVAPIAGYQSGTFSLGARVQLLLSRPSAADLSLTQQWLIRGNSLTDSQTRISLGYAVTNQLRLATEWRGDQSGNRVGLFLELLP